MKIKGEIMLKVGFGVTTGTNIITSGITAVFTPTTEPPEESVMVNEDGSGDAILFENEDRWVTE